jgi:hypothetical protein
MKSRLVIAACVAVRAWAWLYTLPLDRTAQRARRDEIESDLWEFRHDTSRHDAAVWDAIQILAGAVLAMPDDLLGTCEQLPDHLGRPRLSPVFGVLVVVVGASSFVVSASGPALNPLRSLLVNVTSTGWTSVANDKTASALVPAFAFTLTNIGDQRTSALQINALFYWTWPKPDGLGTTFSPAVGWRGLAPGATSQLLVLRAQGWTVGDRARLAPHGSEGHAPLADARVKLFVQHEGRWTLLGDFPIRAQLMHP